MNCKHRSMNISLKTERCDLFLHLFFFILRVNIYIGDYTRLLIWKSKENAPYRL